MYTFIGIERLAANALIELLEKKDVRSVSFDTLVAYGMEVRRVFEQTTGEEAILLLSREYQVGMINDYSHFFEVEMDENGANSFRLKKDANIEDVKKYFRWSMGCSLFKAFTNEQALETLLRDVA